MFIFIYILFKNIYTYVYNILFIYMYLLYLIMSKNMLTLRVIKHINKIFNIILCILLLCIIFINYYFFI